jgi:hypothetical protein
MKFSTGLYKVARATRSIESLASPSKTARRAKNVAVGRGLARGGFWNLLFGGGKRRDG